MDQETFAAQLQDLLGKYRRTLETDRRFLLEHVPVRRHGPQGRRGGLRRDPLLYRADARP